MTGMKLVNVKLTARVAYAPNAMALYECSMEKYSDDYRPSSVASLPATTDIPDIPYVWKKYWYIGLASTYTPPEEGDPPVEEDERSKSSGVALLLTGTTVKQYLLDTVDLLFDAIAKKDLSTAYYAISKLSNDTKHNIAENTTAVVTKPVKRMRITPCSL